MPFPEFGGGGPPMGYPPGPPMADPMQQAWGPPPASSLQPPPPPPPPISDPEPPSKAFQDEALEYVGKFCKASKNYVEKKKPTLEKYLRLYNGELSIFDWQKGSLRASDISQSRVSLFLTKGSDGNEELGLADYVHPCAPLIHSFAHNSYLQVFSGPEYLTVVSEDEQGGPTSDEQFPTEYKIQQLLLRKLSQGRIFSNVFKSLINLPLFGTVAAKIYWHSHRVPRWKWDLQTFQKIRDEETVYECPIIQPIPLDRWLPDPQALSPDINLWRGVGHVVARTYEDIQASFLRGTYNLNEKEFNKRWKDGKGGGDVELNDDLIHDEDADREKDDTLWLDIWEWHGRIPSKTQGLVECCATLVTDKNSDNPEDALLIRLTNEPILSSGYRPFVCAHWSEGEVFGQGLVAENEDTLYTLSQLIGQLEDVARHTAVPVRSAQSGSAAYNFMKDRGFLQPGDVIPFDDPNELGVVPPLQAPTGDIVRLVQMFTGTLEQISGQTSTYQGVATGDQTATGMSILQKQSMAPNSTKTQLFAANFLEPALNIALGMLQQFTLTDQQIMVRTYGGEMKPLTVTAQELQRGKYTCKVVLTDQSHTRIAKAQSLERFLPMIPNIQPALQQEGWQISVADTINRYTDALDIDGADRMLKKIGTQEAALQQQIQSLQQQLQEKDKKAPSVSIPYAALPPVGQVQAAGLAGIQLSPQDVLPFQGMMPVGQQPGPNGGGVSPDQMRPGFNGGPLAEHGGPMGPQPNDQNAEQQTLQLMMQMQAPGQPGPGQGGGMQ